MNNPVEDSQVNDKMRKSSPVNLFLVFLLVGLAVFGGFLSFQKGGVLTHTSDLETQNKAVLAQIDQLKGSKVEVSQNAKDALNQIKTDEIHWSEVISNVNQLIPMDASGKPRVDILSYSGSGSGRIALNVVTQPSSLPAFDDVAGVIATFNNSVFFKNAYVPSISKGQTQDGAVTLSFVLNLEYQKSQTGSEDLNLPTSSSSATSGVTKVLAPQPNAASDSSTPKVPRNNQ